MPLYFAYGSDMSMRQMQQRLLDAEIFFKEDSRSAARLIGYELRFDKAIANHPQIGLACVHKHPGSVVEGILYSLPPHAIEIFDRYEDVANGHYQRTTLEVETELGPVQAQVYIPVHDKIKPGLKPSRNHLYRLLAGERFLSNEYFQKLKKVESLKVPVDEDGMPHPPKKEA